MSDGNSVINLGDLAKPATVLIEKIADAFEGAFKPFQMKRVAKAEAEAALTKAKADLEIADMQRRAINRFFAEEVKKQENMESITAKALPMLEKKAKPEKLDADWITNFFDKCRIVSDEEMQTLWAKVLAGEANSPGAFSKRTVTLLGSLESREAKQFSSLCRVAWEFVDGLTPLVFNPHDRVYARCNITPVMLLHLDAIGLIRFGSFDLNTRPIEGDERMWYFGRPLDIVTNYALLLCGSVAFTKVGKELATLSSAKPIKGFYEYVVDHYRSEGDVKTVLAYKER